MTYPHFLFVILLHFRYSRCRTRVIPLCFIFSLFLSPSLAFLYHVPVCFSVIELQRISWCELISRSFFQSFPSTLISISVPSFLNSATHLVLIFPFISPWSHVHQTLSFWIWFLLRLFVCYGTAPIFISSLFCFSILLRIFLSFSSCSAMRLRNIIISATYKTLFLTIVAL